MLIGVVRPIRASVAPSFALAVKVNSADFQRGDFDADDAGRVIAMVEPVGVDLVEPSGGSYESPPCLASEPTLVRRAGVIHDAGVVELAEQKRGQGLARRR
jgi:2,4-dienoyl-CoA reductase-like NADH-dependent reductase (Old Yellow Enzyme family)